MIKAFLVTSDYKNGIMTGFIATTPTVLSTLLYYICIYIYIYTFIMMAYNA